MSKAGGNKVKIAQIQHMVHKDKADTAEMLKKECEAAAGQNADIVALPEMFCCPYETVNFPAYAEEEGGFLWSECSGLARKYGIYLSAGTMPERSSDGRIFNTAYVFDRHGRQIAKHRKMHLFDIDVKGGLRFKESETLAAGDSINVFQTEFGKFGICICYDFRFPELGRLMALKGAEAVLVPAAFNMTTGPAHWEIMFSSQSVNNQIYTIGTAPARDSLASYTSWGHSIVCDPWGRVLSQMDENEGMAVSEIDLSYVEEVREQLPLLRHRRTDVYKLEEI